MKSINRFSLYFLFALCLILSGTINAQHQIEADVLKNLKISNESEINSALLESSPAFVGDKIGFVFTETKSNFFDKSIDEAFFQLGYATVLDDHSLTSKTAYNHRINSDYHEGPMTYDAIKNTLFFTRSHKSTKLSKGQETDTFYLRIMSADLNTAKPTVKPINLNVDQYSVCHPTLSKDGKTMIFSSNKPGGNGKMDLYVSYFDGAAWSGVLNLGSTLNSSANEIFPFLLNDTILVYTSDRKNGFGGLDLYYSFLKNGSWSSPIHFPQPFNSSFDDLGLIIRPNGRSGYFTSNRPGGKGKDDIYRFQTSASLFEKSDLMVKSEIQVLDKLSLEPIQQAKITLTPLDIDINSFALSGYNIDMLSGRNPGDVILKLSPKQENALPSTTTDDYGKQTFELKKGQKYLLSIDAEHYNTMTLIYDYDVFGGQFNVVLEPRDSVILVEENEDLKQSTETQTSIESFPTEVGTVIVFENIYYQYNSAVIQKGAEKELDLLAEVMASRPQMKVRLESHTDSRGSTAYNLQLSIRRAQAARAYLASQGIDEDRISIRGFGENNLRNECKDAMPCSEKEHSFNRRTEVVIEQ